MSELLAKSPQNGRYLTLVQHTRDVMDAAESLFGIPVSPTRLGLAWLRFFRISEDCFRLFHGNLLASAAFHDWGKANDGMQTLLRGEGQQVIRHEHLSGLLLVQPGFVNWLTARADPAIDQDIVLAAVISHHLKANSQSLALPVGAGLRFRTYCEHPDFRELMGLAAERLPLTGPLPEVPADQHWGYRDPRGNLPANHLDVGALRQRLRDERLDRFNKAVRRDEPRRRLLWAVRSALIAADAAASGLRRENLPLQAWLGTMFADCHLCDKAFVWSEVIEKRIAQVRRQGKWQSWNTFQDDCADPAKVPERALLLAPCGSGKTLAAWRWIAARLGERPAARVIFLYPTRATAKEGFRDYVSWAPEADATLMHGTSAYDLQGMFANEPDDPRSGQSYETQRRLYAIGYWTRRVFSATVDQFLAFLQFSYGPVCMLPVLVDSVLVIDEVHSFDRPMFSALKAFLQAFDLPVLCMTSTLQQDQQEQLRQCGLTLYNERPGDLQAIAAAPRYRLRQTTQEKALALVTQAVAEGKRVLWVVNQVRRAQLVFCDCRNKALGVPIYCYHSRFRLQDRRERHEEVVRGFRSHSPPALAITTQVCEMSLDMDADLLLTERCPVTSLIQRMGRCHRDRELRPESGDVWIYEPLGEQGKPDLNPYDPDALIGVGEFLTQLERADRRVSQIDLERALAAAAQPPAREDVLTSFLTSGPYAMGGAEDFRDIEEFTVSAVLARDVESFAALRQTQQPTDGLILPVPRRLGRERDSRLPSYLALADDRHYHPLIGFCDRPVAEMGGRD
jgi:CRISPR-associated endonuclease/helicase Cas3